VHVAIAAGGKAQPALEPPLRQLHPVDRRGAELRRQHALPGHDERSILDGRNHAFRIDAGQRQKHENLALGLQHVGRWLPDRNPMQFPDPYELRLQALGARQHLACLRPHPVLDIARRHGPLAGFRP
jgi:hypothetical protein